MHRSVFSRGDRWNPAWPYFSCRLQSVGPDLQGSDGHGGGRVLPGRPSAAHGAGV